MGTLTNNEDPDNVAFHQGLLRQNPKNDLQRRKHHFIWKVLTNDPLSFFLYVLTSVEDIRWGSVCKCQKAGYLNKRGEMCTTWHKA